MLDLIPSSWGIPLLIVVAVLMWFGVIGARILSAVPIHLDHNYCAKPYKWAPMRKLLHFAAGLLDRVPSGWGIPLLVIFSALIWIAALKLAGL